MNLNAELLRSSTNGAWLARMPEIALPADRPADMPAPTPGSMHAPILRVSTDTRTTRPGDLFIALRGENHDAHAYLIDAVKAGAVALVVDDAARVPSDAFRAATGGVGVGILKVADTGRALLAIAGAYRRTFTRTKVIAVCGSNGKTTTTRLIHQLLGTTLKGSHSPKSFNNAIGVPLTLLGAQATDQYVVCEVGTNAPGEVAMLGSIVEPDVAVITSIGREHLEGLGDLAGVAREEAAILGTLRPKGVAIVNADAPELLAQLKAKLGGGGASSGHTVVTFGTGDGANLRATGVRHARGTRVDATTGREAPPPSWSLRFGVNGRGEYTMPVLGEHNALNALAAIAVARRFNIDEEKIARALASATLPEMRLEQRHCFLSSRARERATTIVADCYNANPDSMLAAIETLASLGDGNGGAGGRRVVVLGDMLELGPQTELLHRQVLERIMQLDEEAVTRIGLVVLVGEQMRRASAVLTDAHWPASRVVCVAGVEDAALADAVAALLMPGDLVLLKGSRRMGLERVLTAVERRAAGVAPGAAAVGPRRAEEEHGAPGGAGVTGVKGRVPTKT